MNKFKEWQEKKASPGRQVILLLIGALIFPTGIPAILVLLLPRLDERIGIVSFYAGSENFIIGGIPVLLGGSLAIWSVSTQVKLASGTPLPMLPTQKLIISGPFKICRNPMTLGTLLAYAGAAVWVGSYSALLAVAILAALLITYLKLVEEKELSVRFEQEYLEYKKVTPFLFPRFRQISSQ